MLEEQVKEVMRSALLNGSKNYKIDLKDVRVKMKLSQSEDATVCILVNKVLEIEQLSWTKILGMKVFFKSVIVKTITEGLKNIAKQNNIDEDKISVRVYAIDQSGNPALYLYNGKNAVREVKINEVINT